MTPADDRLAQLLRVQDYLYGELTRFVLGDAEIRVRITQAIHKVRKEILACQPLATQ